MGPQALLPWHSVVLPAGSASHAVEVAAMTSLLPKCHCIIQLHPVLLAEQSGINHQKKAMN